MVDEFGIVLIVLLSVGCGSDCAEEIVVDPCGISVVVNSLKVVVIVDEIGPWVELALDKLISVISRISELVISVDGEKLVVDVPMESFVELLSSGVVAEKIFVDSVNAVVVVRSIWDECVDSDSNLSVVIAPIFVVDVGTDKVVKPLVKSLVEVSMIFS